MDTARGDRCSVTGYDRESTPELEALAREGINFRNAWSPAGWTGPAHASMFTGLLPKRHGFNRGNREYLDRKAVTLAERLRKAGYRTACLSNNPNVTTESGLVQGFETYHPMFLYPDVGYPSAPATHRNALEWVKRAKGQGEPFFLFINHFEPHLPYTPPEPFREQFRRPSVSPAEMDRVAAFDQGVIQDHNLGIRRIPPGDLRIMSDLYDAEIACLDQAIGDFVAQLREAGLLDDTLLIITSDHGENLGDHGLVDHMFSLHRSIRYVPLIVRLPGGERAGEVIDEVVRLEDLFPTILETCGVEVPKGIDGQSILMNLGGRLAHATLGPPGKFIERALSDKGNVFDPTPLMLDYEAAFDGRLHFIHSSNGVLEVFDITRDPQETTPLRDDVPESPLKNLSFR